LRVVVSVSSARAAGVRLATNANSAVLPLGGRYVVDFFATSVGLVVEVAGGVHRGSHAADRRREETLRRLGYRVVHVQAKLVLRDLKAALAAVRAAMAG
jgi:very-short-patch-repair endonuclease